MKLLLLAASLISLVATGTESISKYNQKYSFQYSFLRTDIGGDNLLPLTEMQES